MEKQKEGLGKVWHCSMCCYILSDEQYLSAVSDLQCPRCGRVQLHQFRSGMPKYRPLGNRKQG